MLRLQRRQQEIVELTRANPNVTRPLLADTLGLSLPTISVAVKDLIKKGLLTEDGYLKSSGGRRARVLAVNPELVCGIGLAASMSGVQGVVADLGGNIVVSRSAQWGADLTREKMLAVLTQVTGELLESSACGPAGIGIGMSGLVRAQEGLSLRFPHVEDWVDVPVAALLHERYGLDVFLENDVNASTLAELRFGKGRGVSNFLYVFIGKGIGLGIVVNGNMYRGSSGNAGELGHMAVGDAGLLCHCGNYGCLETLAGPDAIVAEVTAALAGGALSAVETNGAGAVTVAAVIEAAEKGDRLCESVVTKACEHVGRILGDMANLFDPQLIITGGLLAKGSPRALGTLERVFESRVLPSIANSVRLEVSELGDFAGALGAAEVVFQNFVASSKTK